MTRLAAVLMTVAMAGCSQSGAVVYRAGPPPPNGAQVYSQALMEGQRPLTRPVNCQTFRYPNGQSHTTCQ